MAVQGKLVPQDLNDEPASVLLERIRTEKEQLIKEGKIKKEKKPSIIFRGADNLPYEKVGKNEPLCIADEVPFEIPESWEWVRLGSIGDWGSGATPSRSVPEYYDGDIPWLKTGDLNDGHIKYIPEKISHLALEKTSVRLNPTGSVLIAMYGATIGKVGILTFPATTNQACCACLPIGIYNEYLFYFLMSQKVAFVKQGEGGAQPNISKAKIVATLMPIPPLAEQYRIVAKIKEVIPHIEHYGEIHSSVSSLNVSFPNLLKKSILQEAVQGKLVPQDPTDEPASVLLKRIRAEKEQLIKAGKIKRDKHESVIIRRDNSHYEKLDGIERCIDDEIPFEIPDSWEWVRFYNIASFQNGDRSKNYPNRNEYVSNGVAWINTGHITSDGFLNVNTMNYITEEKYNSLSNGHIQKGDLVYCLRGATFGKVARIEPFSKGAIASSLMIIRPFDVSLRNYIYWYLRSPIAYIELHKYSNGSAQPNLAAKDVGKYLVPIPPLDEQIRILNESIRLLAIIENI